MNNQHITVFLREAVEALNICENGIYVDGTFGRGGHSKAILNRLGSAGKLIVLDKDPQAIEVALQLAKEDSRVVVVHQGFKNFAQALQKLNITQVDGALFDLGISSPQIDEAERGFSFRFDAPLDMRMDTTHGLTAAEWLNLAEEKEIAQIIKEYGEERFSKRIATHIVAKRQENPITTTKELADLVANIVKTKEPGQHPATRTFQAIRIHINEELDEIKEMLPQTLVKLKENGRLVVIAFHSLEDRIVKQFMKEHAQDKSLPKWVAVRSQDLPLPPLKLIGKASKPSDVEIQSNPRARSAVLRVAERTNREWNYE